MPFGVCERDCGWFQAEGARPAAGRAPEGLVVTTRASMRPPLWDVRLERLVSSPAHLHHPRLLLSLSSHLRSRDRQTRDPTRFSAPPCPGRSDASVVASDTLTQALHVTPFGPDRRPPWEATLLSPPSGKQRHGDGTGRASSYLTVFQGPELPASLRLLPRVLGNVTSVTLSSAATCS